MTTHLITRGDDLGSFHEANTAIINSCRNGVLRNAGIMAPTPCFAEAAEMARACPQLCLGLHLTLTSEWDQVRWGPVCERATVPSLIDADGNFLSDPMQIHQRGVNLDECMRELKAQLALARTHGLHIQYFDDHMGASWIHPQPKETTLVDRIRAWAREEGVLWHSDIHGPKGVHELDRTNGAGDGQPTVDSVLAACDRITEPYPLWMTHPVDLGGKLMTIDCRHARLVPGLEARFRDAESRIFQDPRFAAGLAQRDITPTSYVEAARLRSAQAARR